MPYQEVMGKFGRGELHSGSKKGPKVTNRKQAVAIMMSERRKGKKYHAYGSGAFSQREINQGYKVEHNASDLAKMDVDAWDKETLARRRKPGHLRRSEHGM